MNLLKKNPINLKVMSEERMSYSIEKDGMTKDVSVKKAENGYVVCISKHGYKKDSEEYVSEEKTYISTTNPLEKKKEVDPLEAQEEMLSLLDGFGLS